MFLVSITYTVNLEHIDNLLEEHVAFLDEQYFLGNFLVSGRKVPRTGGVILASVPTKTALDSILERDPFYREQVANYEITEFIPSKTAPGLEALLGN